MRFKLRYTATIERLLFALLMSLLAVAVSSLRWGYSVDQTFYDAVITNSSSTMGNDILIVAIDERSLLELGRWPWSRAVHAELVNKLNQAGVKAIAFDVVFAEADRIKPENDFLFAQAMDEMGRVALLVHMEQTHAGGQILEVLPASPLIDTAAALGHVHIEYDVDGVCRAVFLKEGLGEAYWPHLMHSLWLISDNEAPERLPGLKAKDASNGSPFLIQRDYYNLIPLATGASQVASVSYTDIIHDRIPARSLVDKIVIVGATAKGLGDIVATPVGPMAGVEFNANIFNALRSQSTIVPVANSYHVIISALAVFVLIMLGVRATPRQYLLLTVAGVLVIVFASVIALLHLRLWFAPLAIIIPLLVFYPLWSWRRLEQALRFLRVELARVEEQSSQSALVRQSQLNEQLSFLSILTGIDSWQINPLQTNSSTNISAPSPDDSRSRLAVSPMGVNSFTCRIAGDSSDELVNVTWSWPESLTPASRTLWLNTLNSIAVNAQAPKKQVPSELVTATITRLRDANKIAEESRAFFDQCMENLQDAVVVANLMGDVVFANARARATFAINSNSLNTLGNCLNQLHIDGGWQPTLKSLLAKQSEVYAEVASKSGEKHYFMQLAGLNWQSNYVDTLLFSFTDITVVKESERARNEALHFLSHDLRSPVVSILALIEHFRSRASEEVSSEAFGNILQEIETYARKNLSFAESFLQLARAEMVGDNNFDYCDIHSVIDNSHMMVRQLAVAKSIRLSVDRSYEDLWVWGDGELLERALINLLSNAIKYSEPNTEVHLSVARNSDNVVVTVTDQGMGISPQDQKEIFKRFKRIDGQAGVSGAGLGLHFVDTVCRKHGGEIELASEPGVGSSFTLKLPLCSDPFND